MRERLYKILRFFCVAMSGSRSLVLRKSLNLNYFQLPRVFLFHPFYFVHAVLMSLALSLRARSGSAGLRCARAGALGRFYFS